MQWRVMVRRTARFIYDDEYVVVEADSPFSAEDKARAMAEEGKIAWSDPYLDDDKIEVVADIPTRARS